MHRNDHKARFPGRARGCFPAQVAKLTAGIVITRKEPRDTRTYTRARERVAFLLSSAPRREPALKHSQVDWLRAQHRRVRT